MNKKYYIHFFVAISLVFIFDQIIKYIILSGFRWESSCISIVLVYNKGVAFSMFSFLGESLKFIQLLLLSGIIVYTLAVKDVLQRFGAPLGMVVGAGFGNIIDRFIHSGVVDYVYWHCYFDFAIFNFADAMINVAIVWIIYVSLKKK